MCPWANPDLLKETSSFTSAQSITALRESQPFSKSYEHDIVIVPCGVDEPVCRDKGENSEAPFCFFYVASFTKIELKIY